MFRVEYRATQRWLPDEARYALLPGGDWMSNSLGSNDYRSRAAAEQVAALYRRDGFESRVVERDEPAFIDEH